MPEYINIIKSWSQSIRSSRYFIYLIKIKLFNKKKNVEIKLSNNFNYLHSNYLFQLIISIVINSLYLKEKRKMDMKTYNSDLSSNNISVKRLRSHI